jgi:hypothetical protein
MSGISGRLFPICEKAFNSEKFEKYFVANPDAASVFESFAYRVYETR